MGRGSGWRLTVVVSPENCLAGGDLVTLADNYEYLEEDWARCVTVLYTSCHSTVYRPSPLSYQDSCPLS